MPVREAVPPILPPALRAALADLVTARLGLRCPPERLDALVPALDAIALDLGGIDHEACVQRLASAGPAPDHIARLAACLTNGETYFLREPASFQALQDHVLPALVRQKRAAGWPALRIWSAGCATGEEAYSLAMWLELTRPDLAAWDIRIVATDINPDFLVAAERGLYRDWSLRGMTPELKARFFRQRPDGLYQPLPRLSDRIEFGWFNLADEQAPSPLVKSRPFDLILCRNVLVYLDPEASARTVRRFANALSDEGWLLVAAVESPMMLFDGFAGSAHWGVPLFRRQGQPGTEEPASVRPPTPRKRALLQPASPAVRRNTPPSPVAAPDLQTLLAHARSAADRGALAEAARWSARAVEACKTEPAAHYLHATILLEAGHRAEAEAAFRRAAFLAPSFALAHYQLGALALGDRRLGVARRHLDNALTLLAARDPAESFGEAAGLTVAGLAGMAGELRRAAGGEATA